MHRSALVLTVVAASALTLAAAQPAAAQKAPALSPGEALRAAQTAKPCPAGQVFAMVRISTVKPTGSIEGYKEAVRDQLKWYRDHGYMTAEVTAYPVVETPDQGKSWAVSKTHILSIHKNRPVAPQQKQDPSWDAVTAKLVANVDITSDTYFCTAK
jgi:hypothetical protein